MNRPRINIIIGAKQSGKTTYLLKRIYELKSSGKKVSGIISRGTFVKNKRHSFYAQNIETGEEQLLMSVEKQDSSEMIGRFFINQEAFDWAMSEITKAMESDILVLDEIGRFELENRGWADVIPNMIESDKELYFVLREEYIESFIKKYHISDYQVLRIE